MPLSARVKTALRARKTCFTRVRRIFQGRKAVSAGVKMILHGAGPLYSGKSGFAGVQNVFYLGKSYFAGRGGGSIRMAAMFGYRIALSSYKLDLILGISRLPCVSFPRFLIYLRKI